MRPILALLAILLAASGAMAAKDKSKPVRHALEARYALLKRATETRDLALFQSLRTPTFSTRDLSGRSSSAVDMRERAARFFENLRPPIIVRFTLGTIDLQGGKAVVAVRQELSRMQMVGPQLRRVDTRVTQDETWVRTPAGWMLDYVDNERDLLWCVDGKRVKPGIPYDANAPRYDPDHSDGLECRNAGPGN